MNDSPVTRRICVVTPCYNEEALVEKFYYELRRQMRPLGDIASCILFVDDGSCDRTLEILNRIAEGDASVRVLSLSRNFGHQVAITAGLDFADADAVVVMDSDLQHPPALIPEMVTHWRNGFDVVLAVRQYTADASFLKRKSSALFYVFFNCLSDVKLTPGAADFYLLSRRAHQALQHMPERHRLLRGMVAWIGFPRIAVPYTAAARTAGVSKFTPAKMWRLAIDAVFSFSATPIRMASRVGLVILSLAFCYFCFSLYFALFKGGTVQGWTSIVTVILGLGGTQLVFIGLIGEYLSRVYEESKGRPLYFVKQEPTGSTVLEAHQGVHGTWESYGSDG